MADETGTSPATPGAGDPADGTVTQSAEDIARLLAEIDRRLSTPKLHENLDEDLEPYLAEMRGYRATYLTVVAKARAARCPFNPAIVVSALNEFDAIEAELLLATTDIARTTLVDRAEEVEQERAYIQPVAEIMVEAKTCFADMSDWGVPTPVLEKIETDLFSIIKSSTSSLAEKRAALNKLYAYYDAWSDHVADYEGWATRTAWFLGALLILATLGCVAAIHYSKPLHGFMTAGLAGALMSVLGKFPPMLGWGQWASYTPRMLGRITTGLVTTLVGGALLSLDAIKFGERSFSQLFKLDPTAPPGQGLRDMLLVIGLGIVFGFSERALVQFQNIVFSTSTGKEEP